MVDAPASGPLREVVEPEHLIAEEQVRVVGPLAEELEPELLHQEPAELHPVAHFDVHVVEAEELDLGDRRDHGTP